MKKFSTIAGIMALVLFLSVLVGTSDVVLAQGPKDGHPGKGFLGNLTDEQREVVQEKIKEMRDQDATREEIRSAVAELLQGYGIEMPENRGGWRGFGHGRDGLRSNLTDEQRQTLREKKKELRSQGANHEEIRAAVAEMLKGYGVELPENWPGWHGPHGFGHWRDCLGADLNDEQKEAIRERIKERRSEGATREEIRVEAAEMFEGYGIELPDFISKLTDEQRKVIRSKIREMRRQGDACEEIRAAVTELLEGFGIESPEDSESTSSEMAPAGLHIIAKSYPNPFNPETNIVYTLSVSENVRIGIYNVSGQLIRTYDIGYQPAGSYSMRWDGRNQNGDMTASGVYLYRIEAGPYEVTNRMVLLK